MSFFASTYMCKGDEILIDYIDNRLNHIASWYKQNINTMYGLWHTLIKPFPAFDGQSSVQPRQIKQIHSSWY